MTPHQFLLELWPKIHGLEPELKFQIVNFENAPENAREILARLGQNIDVVAGIFDETMLNLRGCTAFELNPSRSAARYPSITRWPKRKGWRSPICTARS